MRIETNDDVGATTTSIDEKISRFIPELHKDLRREPVVHRLKSLLSEPTFKNISPLSTSEIHSGTVSAGAHPRFADYFRALGEGWTRDIAQDLTNDEMIAVDNRLQSELADVVTASVSGQLLRTVLQVLEEHRVAGLLAGSDAHARFLAFHQWLTSSAGSEYMAAVHGSAYALARQGACRAVRNFKEILNLVVQDLPLLSQTFPAIARTSLIRSVATGAGDNHADGRSVAIVTFDNGSKVVFKPRNIQSDVALSSLIMWTNEAGLTNLRTVEALPCGSYGYVEFLETAERPQTGDNLRCPYFEQIGQLTAVLYLLRASDIHFENVIATDEGPVVVDTETLLTPVPRRDAAYDDGAGSSIARNKILESVLGIGILPTLVSVPSREGAIDIGAVGYNDGQTAPIKALVVLNEGRDDMHTALEFRQFTRHNAPAQQVEPTIAPCAQRDAIGDAFTRVLEGFIERRNELRSLIDDVFAECVHRFVPSPTIFYSQLLRMATHPSVLTDREAKAAVLYRVCLREAATSVSLADAELRQLYAGDVPYFTYSPTSTSLFGRAPGSVEHWSEHTEFFAAPGLTAVQIRLAGLDAEAIAEQRRLIDYAYVNKLESASDLTGLSVSSIDPGTAPSKNSIDRSSNAIRALKALLDPVVSTIIDSHDPQHPATWMEPLVTTSDQSQWLPGTLGYDLYGGTAGVALVLAGAGTVMNEPRYQDAADRVLGPIGRQLSEGRIEESSISSGGFTGMGGTIYAIAKAAAFQGNQNAVEIPAMLTALAHAGGRDGDLPPDITVGAVGALAAGLAARATLNPAQQSKCDEPLRRIAQRAFRAVKRLDITSAYTGYAHGIAGIAAVLLRAGAALNDEALNALGREMFHLLDGSRAQDEDDWPRSIGDAGAERSYSWCHGAPGLLLAYAEVESLLPGVVPDGRIERLIELTLARGLGNNPTLCHGDAGTLDVLIEACSVSSAARAQHLSTITRQIHQAIATRVLQAGTNRQSKYSFTSSLMVGSAGTAWTLLRGLDPQRFPSVLRLG